MFSRRVIDFSTFTGVANSVATRRKVLSVEMQIHVESKGIVAMDDITLWA